MSLSAARTTPARAGTTLSLKIAADTVIYEGALVCRDANGRAVPGSVATTLRGVGRARATYDNSGGANDALDVEVDLGIFRYGNSASTDAIATADIGNTCYVVDDETVAKTNGTNTRSKAGVVHDVDDSGVWVHFDTAAPI